MAKIGTPSDGSALLWACVLGSETETDKGTFGLHGARTEQFAIGSILYYITRDYEPYDDENFGQDYGPIIVNRLRRMAFPSLGGGHLDRIIERCWNADFALLEHLAEKTKLLCGAVERPRATSLNLGYCLERRLEC